MFTIPISHLPIGSKDRAEKMHFKAFRGKAIPTTLIPAVQQHFQSVPPSLPGTSGGGCSLICQHSCFQKNITARHRRKNSVTVVKSHNNFYSGWTIQHAIRPARSHYRPSSTQDSAFSLTELYKIVKRLQRSRAIRLVPEAVRELGPLTARTYDYACMKLRRTRLLGWVA